MNRPAISIKNLSKTYRIWKNPSDLLVESLTGRRRHTEFRAINDLSLDVAKGSILGILGRNGAGKSTLLRIIAGTLDATSGAVTVDGRVSAILELGTGFHLDYTGRQNIKLGAMCLGLSASEVAAREQEIIDFAELGDFIDRPFRTYSSGMQARLTFAVATSVDPEILIIDEALSVGDIRFQRKSFARIEAYARRGVTILFVTQDTQTIAQLAHKALVLDAGAVYQYGDPGEAISKYSRLMFGGEPGLTARAPRVAQPETAPPQPAPVKPVTADEDALEAGDWGGGDDAPEGARSETRFGDGDALIEDVWIEDEHGVPADQIGFGRPFHVAVKVRARNNVEDYNVGFRLTTVEGKDVYGVSCLQKRRELQPLKSGEAICVRFRNASGIAPGWFYLTAAVARIGSDRFLDRRLDAVYFRVHGSFDGFTSSLIDLAACVDVVQA